MVSPKRPGDGALVGIPLWRVKAYYFASFSFFATYYRYLTLFFEADGFSASEIGFIISVARALTTLVVPFWNALADRTKRARTIQLVSLLASLSPFLALRLPAGHGPAGRGLLARGATFWAFTVISAPSGSMMDALAREACGQDADRWGKARIYGAVGWGLMHLVLGPLYDSAGFDAMFVAFVALAAVLLLATRLGTPEACSAASAPVNVLSVLGILRRNPIFFANITVLGCGFSMVEGMLFILLREMKASTLLCGFSVVVTVIFELPIFAHAKPLLMRLGNRNMILLGQAAWVVRALFYWRMSVAWSVLLIEPLHGITFALVWTAAIDHVAQPGVCGEGLEASAQGLLSSCFMGVGPIVGLLLGGVLFDKVGGHVAYSIFAVCVCFSGFVYWHYGDREARKGSLPTEEVDPAVVGKMPNHPYDT